MFFLLSPSLSAIIHAMDRHVVCSRVVIIIIIIIKKELI